MLIQELSLSIFRFILFWFLFSETRYKQFCPVQKRMQKWQEKLKRFCFKLSFDKTFPFCGEIHTHKALSWTDELSKISKFIKWKRDWWFILVWQFLKNKTGYWNDPEFECIQRGHNFSRICFHWLASFAKLVQNLSINGSVLKNPGISGALYTLRVQHKYIQIQCEVGARDFRVL